jgi:WD40 repeat protein
MRCELNVSHTVDCISPGQRRWPEDLAWHPLDETLFAVYTANGGPQIGIIKTCKTVSSTKHIIISKISVWQIFMYSIVVGCSFWVHSVCHIFMQKPGVKFVDDKPHEKRIVNTIEFMPWSNASQFVTGGCDHGVVLWIEKGQEWQPRLLHTTLHSSAVTGVGGIPNKNYIISSGSLFFFTWYHRIWIILNFQSSTV